MSAAGPFIDRVYKLARDETKKANFPVSILIAQAIIESNYGKSSLASKYNNLFGMKVGSGKYGTFAGSVNMKTKEYIQGKEKIISDNFRTYRNEKQSIIDYLDRQKRFGVTGTNINDVLIKLQKSGYATAPEYILTVKQVVKTYRLDKLDNYTAIKAGNGVLLAVMLGLGLILIVSE